MKTSEYWQKRALKREKEAYLKGQELNKKLLELYESASDNIRKQINDFYHRYASENGLTYNEALKEINKSEYKEWQKSLEEYVREYETETDPVRAAEIKAQVDARAYRSRITRLEAVNAQIEGAVNVLYFKSLKEMKKDFAEIFEKSFIGKAEDIAEHLNKSTEFIMKSFDEKIIEDVISYPWCGNHFSDRLWKNKENLIFNLKEILSDGLQNGTALPQMAKEMADNTGQSFTAAYALVQTESTHFHEEANFRAYEGAGIEQYQFLAEHQLTTCSICAELDSKVFDVKDRKAGINAPPIHPRCRCITVEYDPHEKEDYIKAGLEPPEDELTWKQWYDNEVKRRGKEAVENEIKMYKNKSADKKQFEEYAKILGKNNVPKNLDEFQNLKYNNDKGWELFKDYKNSRATGMISAFTSFGDYMYYKNMIEKELVGLVTFDGIKIKSQSKHFIERVIGTSKDPKTNRPRSGVELDDIKYTLLNGTKRKRVDSTKYISEKCIVSINEETGVLIQVNPQ